MNALPMVLAAEDEETDALILRLAFEKAGVTNPLIIVRDGQEVINYLTGNSPRQEPTAHPMPALLTLDLKMPRMNGFDVLAWLRTRSEFKYLPAVVISSSSDEADIEKARSLGARDYFVKPHYIGDFIAIMHTLQRRWLVHPAA
jgi:CheY-like chemotaxis protein